MAAWSSNNWASSCGKSASGTHLAFSASFAALVPPPRTHRHRYFGVLAPNLPLRVAVTALAQGAPAQPGAAQASATQEFPGALPLGGGQMRLIAFITHSADIRQILDHIGVESQPPHIAPAGGPPLWEDCDAQMDDGVHIEPDWDLAAQPAPDDEVDQRVNW